MTFASRRTTCMARDTSLTYSRAAVMLCLLASVQVAAGQVSEEDDSEAVRSSQESAQESAVDERPKIAESIIERTNKFRRQKGRESVEANSELNEAAAYFASYMARTNRYG